MLKKKIWANFQRIVEVFTQKIFNTYALKYMGLGSGIRDPGSEIRDPRSGIRKKPIPDPRVKKAPDPGSGSATLDSRVHKTTYAPMIYTALRVRFLMWADRLRGEGGRLALEILSFVGPK